VRELRYGLFCEEKNKEVLLSLDDEVKDGIIEIENE